MLRSRPYPKADHRSPRPWALTACGRLIALQGLGYFGLAWFNSHGSFPQSVEALWQPASYGLLAILLLANALSLLRLRSGAWNAAMTLQGAGLLLALLRYFDGQRGFVLLQLLVGILLVLYLNHPEIRARFPLEPFEAPPEDVA